MNVLRYSHVPGYSVRCIRNTRHGPHGHAFVDGLKVMDDLLPTRSRTDPPAPEQHRTQRDGIRKRIHANTLGQLSTNNNPRQYLHQHHHHRNVAKDAVQSAVELKPPISFEKLLNRDKKSPEQSSRDVSGNQPDEAATAQQQLLHTRKVSTADVAKAKRDNTKREEELRSSLKGVEKVGMDSTRELDDTYYSILEKASILRSTVASLQQLANDSKKMHSQFKEETEKLETETKQSVESFDNFDQQEETINALVKRLQESRDKTSGLNDRLESARLRVEAYEGRDNAKQARRRAQWHTVWLILFGVAVVLVAILVLKNRDRVGDAVEQQLLRIGDLVEDVAAPGIARLRASPTKDPYLGKLFDEL